MLQAVSGIAHLTGNQDAQPTPMGVAAADILAGTHLVQGILAVLYGKDENTGGLVQVNMLESLLDFQFECLTCFYNDGNELPERSAVSNGNAYIGAPYGIYRTADTAIALAMGKIDLLGELLGSEELTGYKDPADWFSKRDEIKAVFRDHLITRPTREWLSILEPADIWCAPVFNYDDLIQEEGYQVLEMEQEIQIKGGWMKTTRCPIRIDGEMIKSAKGAPVLGEHTQQVFHEFGLHEKIVI